MKEWGRLFCLSSRRRSPVTLAHLRPRFPGTRGVIVLMLADQLILRLEDLHSKTFLHRDIKPDNFLMGRGRHSDTVYAIDFGLSKRYFFFLID